MRRFRPPEWYRKHPPQLSVFWGLKEVNLSIQEGDRVAIIGHNGAGKSTLLKVISRIYRPSEGTIDVSGRVAPLIEIGAGFHPELSGKENAFLNGSILGIPRAIISEKMNSIISFSELGDFIDMPVKYYSTGMYMRLAFTLATEVVPDILILDELFAGGDADFVRRADVRLKDFVERSNILILVTHNMDYVKELCNRAILLDHGKIKMEGTPKEVIETYLREPPSLVAKGPKQESATN